MIYSAAKNNPDLNIGWARQSDEGLPRPDLVVFLDLGLEEAERRGGYGEEKYEKREMQERVKQLYGALHLAQGDEADDMHVIDAGHETQEVAESVWKIVSKKIVDVENDVSGDLRKITPWKKGVIEDISDFITQ